MASSKPYAGDIPFHANGDQMHYADDRWYPADLWVPNAVFQDVLTYKTYCRGRSSAYFEFVRSNGATVNVFLADFDTMAHQMVQGKITGTFAFCKRGANFGCKLVDDGTT